MTASRAEAPRREWLAATLLVLIATAAFAALTWPTFRPPAGVGGDITQDWLSAREYLSGHPAYGDLGDASLRHLGSKHKDDALRWNAHPPVSLLLFLPFARLSHEDAFFAWNLVTLPLFVAAVWLVTWQLGASAARAATITAAVTLAAAVPVVGCYPLQQQVQWGQFSAPIAFLLAVAWAADRHDRPALAGAAVGVAAAVKLFPAFVLLYFAASGRWRALVVACVCAVGLNAAALATFGFDAFRTYASEVVPGVSATYGTHWANLSARGFWLRLFDPAAPSRVTALADAPFVGRALEIAVRGALTVTVAWLAWRAADRGRRDRAFAAAVAAMVLVSPVSWSHSLVLLVIPVGLAVRDTRGAWRWPLLVCLVVLWMPMEFVTGVAFGREFASALMNAQPRPLTPAENLLGIAVPHYALVALFLLVVRLPVEPPARVPIINPDQPPAG